MKIQFVNIKGAGKRNTNFFKIKVRNKYVTVWAKSLFSKTDFNKYLYTPGLIFTIDIFNMIEKLVDKYTEEQILNAGQVYNDIQIGKVKIFKGNIIN